MKTQALDPFGIAYGICNPLYGVQMVFSEDMADAFCRALNDWLVQQWLDKEPRLRGSIVIPVQSVEKSVAEIERCAKDHCFVQVLMLVMADTPLGKRAWWPIYAVAERLGQPIGVHAGSNYHNPPTSVGWGSYHIEHVAQSQAFQTQLTGLIVEGVFARHPNLKMVLLESGFTWLPAGVLERFPKLKMIMIEAGFGWAPSLSWRLDRNWEKLRSEVPHLKRPPSEYIRDQIWWTTQPMEDPERRDHLFEVIDWVGWDKLLFATDYPHWDYDEPSRVLPAGVSDANREALYLGNARKLHGLA